MQPGLSGTGSRSLQHWSCSLECWHQALSNTVHHYSLEDGIRTAKDDFVATQSCVMASSTAVHLCYMKSQQLENAVTKATHIVCLGLPYNAETSMYACSNDYRIMGWMTLVPTGTSTPRAMWLVIMYVHRLFFSPRQPYLTAMQPFSAIWIGY